MRRELIEPGLVLIAARTGWSRAETEALPLRRFLYVFEKFCPKE